uniref:Putative gagpol polyprotein putative n=1 Tax=Albugo laibachii Nc14 TaxID=890382 RepID=F0WUA0_9STRA|nr:Putative gagpol polyprotein putative [Albugo laibachii Nc14]|eukprot:CCA24978.1 Putative gagpol polyprotein putative [Albugo laibachii Nc14]
MQSKHRDEWRKAMENEMKSLNDHHTWKLLEMQPGHRAVGGKWVVRIKRDPSGKIFKFKTRLVAKRYTQRPGIDYTEMFAPVARKDSTNIVPSIAAVQGMEAENVDGAIAFLYGDIDEENYMDQPDGFEDEKYPNMKCKLHANGLTSSTSTLTQWDLID